MLRPPDGGLSARVMWHRMSAMGVIASALAWLAVTSVAITGCGTTSPDGTLERNKQLVRQMNAEVWNKANVDAIDGFYTPSVVLHFLPDETETRGVEGSKMVASPSSGFYRTYAACSNKSPGEREMDKGSWRPLVGVYALKKQRVLHRQRWRHDRHQRARAVGHGNSVASRRSPSLWILSDEAGTTLSQVTGIARTESGIIASVNRRR